MKEPLQHPTPEQITEARNRAGLSLRAAGELVHASQSGWAGWEYAQKGRKMPLAEWELFLRKTGQWENNQ